MKTEIINLLQTTQALDGGNQENKSESVDSPVVDLGGAQ